MTTLVTTWHLEMTEPDALRPARPDGGDFVVRQVGEPLPELNRFLYAAVGHAWHWVDRLEWPYDRWRAYVERPELETWVGYRHGTPAGYFELEAQGEGNVELAYFGLLPRFTGQKLGGPLLTSAVERAWARGARRVWVHTCSLDHPAALANYQARGFTVFKEEQALKDLPPPRACPW
jgi:GNAT superfamily N-acetyltransferase